MSGKENSTRQCTILLGSAVDSTNDPAMSDSKMIIRAATSKDMTAARANASLNPSSLQHLDIKLNDADISLYDPMELAGWVKCLQEGSNVRVEIKGSAAVNVSAIHSSFTLAGLKGASESKEADGSRVLTASRPLANQSSGARALPKQKPAGFNICLGGDNEDDLIDEDGLLSGDILVLPPSMEAKATANGDDCSGRKACDNCTCGRAGEEVGFKKNEQGSSKSSCGKCGLGDAFRCASCPYLGMPAFKPGEEPVLLDLQDDF